MLFFKVKDYNSVLQLLLSGNFCNIAFERQILINNKSFGNLFPLRKSWLHPKLPTLFSIYYLNLTQVFWDSDLGHSSFTLILAFSVFALSLHYCFLDLMVFVVGLFACLFLLFSPFFGIAIKIVPQKLL